MPQIATGIINGLNYLHGNNILHRDLKSPNVLLEYKKNGYRAVIGDFGLAHVKNENSLVTVKGTPYWMAPELFQYGGECTKASDVWSYGIILWELTTRKIPMNDVPSPQVGTYLQSREWPEAIPPEAMSNFAKLMTMCWNKNLALRPTTQEIIAELETTDNTQPISGEQTTNSDILTISTQNSFNKSYGSFI